MEELDYKQRKIRSFRGFFLYALEIIETAKDYEILETNLQPFFWRKVKTIIRQNKKAALQEFLFGKDEDKKSVGEDSIPYLENQIQALKKSNDELCSQVNSLSQQVPRFQQKVIDLEAKLFGLMNSHGASFQENSKYPLSSTRKSSNKDERSQQDHSTLKRNSSPSLTENDRKVRKEEILQSEQQSNLLLKAYKSPLKTDEPSEESNIPSASQIPKLK